MNLTLAWSAPSPAPDCGYRALYRRKSDPSYTQVDVSGTTATIAIAAPASYEGRILSNCCSDDSSGTPYGVNGYGTISAVVSKTVSPLTYIVTITSDFPNPYDIIISGTYTSSVYGVVGYTATYPADSTSAVITLPGTPSGLSENVSNTTIGPIAPVFNNGGELQQFDMVNTPPYFKMYWSGDISGTTWNGSPMSLPSFTLDSFTPTEMAVDGVTVLAGRINISYILPSVYASPYSSYTLEVLDPSGLAVIGAVVVTKTPLGLRTTAINISKSVSAIDTSTQFIMKMILPDLTEVDSKVFRLPDF